MRAIVVGGGVGGATAALGLRRVGVDVTVYEAYADPAGDVGSFVSLASNGLRGLEALGCLDAVRAVGFVIPRQRMWSAGGRLLGDVVFNLTFGRNGAFLHLAAGDDVWWAAQIADPVEPNRAGVSDTGWLRHTAELYRDERVPSAIIAATTRLHPTVLMHAVDPIPVWHSDRIVLVGDAAHPVGAGQGASMAIEDALVLAAVVRTEPTLAGALAAYDAARRPRVVKVLAAADDNRGRKKAGAVKRSLQATMMRAFIPLGYEKATAWLYAYPPGPTP